MHRSVLRKIQDGVSYIVRALCSNARAFMVVRAVSAEVFKLIFFFGKRTESIVSYIYVNT